MLGQEVVVRVGIGSRFPQGWIADHAQAASAATARVPVVAIGWKPKGIARPEELLLINRADLERAGDTHDSACRDRSHETDSGRRRLSRSRSISAGLLHQAAGRLKVPMSRAKPRMWVLMVNPTTAARTPGGSFKLGTSNAYTVS